MTGTRYRRRSNLLIQSISGTGSWLTTASHTDPHEEGQVRNKQRHRDSRQSTSSLGQHAQRLERDIPQFGPRIAAERLRRFWAMLAHLQAGLLNIAQLARNLGVDAKTAAAYIDLLADLLLVRRLSSWQANVGKRLVKSPKVYVRDSGLVHALLAIGDKETLFSHPVVGASWEGFAVEQMLAVAPEGVHGHFYRTSGGAEIDLVLSFPDGRLWAVEIKRSLSPRPDKGFQAGCADLRPARRFVVYPGEETYPVGNDTEVVPLPVVARLLAGTTQ